MPYALTAGEPWGLYIATQTFLQEKYLRNTTMRPVKFDTIQEAYARAHKLRYEIGRSLWPVEYPEFD